MKVAEAAKLPLKCLSAHYSKVMEYILNIMSRHYVYGQRYMKMLKLGLPCANYDFHLCGNTFERKGCAVCGCSSLDNNIDANNWQRGIISGRAQSVRWKNWGF